MKAFGIVLLSALAYFGFGKLGLYLAIPPGYATAIWPSSGVALALALRFGRLSYPGTYLGSLLVNLGVSHAFSAPSLSALLMPASIACGAVLQAEVGRLLVARFVANIWSQDHSIAFILLLGGPVSCLVAASIGASSLLGFHQIGWPQYQDVWLTWWMGDSLGVLAFTPALLILLAPAATITPVRRAIVVTPLMAMFLLVTLAYIFVRDFEEQQRHNLVENKLQQIVFALDKEFQLLNEASSSLRSHFESENRPSFEVFQHLAHGYLETHPSLRAVEWVPRVSDADRARREADMQAQHVPNFSFTELDDKGHLKPAHTRPEYFPVYFLYPYRHNEHALGFDLNSDPIRRQFIKRAQNLRGPILSEPLHLVQMEKNALGFLLFDPVFDTGQPISAPDKDSLTGFVLLVFSPQKLLSTALESFANDGLHLSIEDITNSAAPTLLVQGSGGIGTYEATRSIRLLNRTWQLSLKPSITLVEKVSNWESYAVLFAGWPFVMVLSVLLIMLTGKQMAIEQQVREKTAELANARDVAQQASRAKSDFLASMSHELRTPLNSIIGFTHQLLIKKKDQLDERSQDSLRIVERNAAHLLELINALLDISKIEAGKMDLGFTTFNLKTLCQEVLEPLRQTARDKGLRLHLDVDDDLELTADRTRVFQILLNLTANAIKFTHQGYVRIGAHREARDDIAGVKLQIQDTGIGISAADQVLLFHKFAQLPAGKREVTGTGLGLALVKEFVTLHHGTVELESEPEKGSVFSVWLPLSQAGYPPKSTT